MAIPKWLRSRLGTPAKGRGCRCVRCIVCRSDLVVGLDNDTCASRAICDPVPLSVIGEALALLDGRRTYELSRHGSGLALYHRDHWQISGRHASDTCIVLADHKCGTPPLPSIKIQPAPLTTPKNSLIYDNEPPF